MLELIEKLPFDPVGWPGNWVWTRDAGAAFEVVQFSCIFANCDDLPRILHISADNRYKLYINGEFIGLGPQRGSLSRWFIETYNLTNLKSGSGPFVFTAVVWHDRETAPSAQIMSQPGFYAVAEFDNGRFEGPLGRWKYKRWFGNSTMPLPEHALCVGAGYDMSGFTLKDLRPTGEEIDKEFEDVRILGLASDHTEGHPQLLLQWNCFPRTIPALKAQENGLGRCRRVIINGIKSYNDNLIDVISSLAENFTKHYEKPVIIPGNSRYKIMLDQEEIVTGYPRVLMSGGKGAVVRLTYQEGLQANGNILSKGNRNEVEDRIIVGISDQIRLAGRNGIICEPFWMRCWRYIELDIQTSNEPLEIHSLSYRSTGYPLEITAEFKSDPWFDRLIVPGIRTLKLCMCETFFDGPYYEQLQYIGDTRISCLLSYVLANDDTLAREAIDAFDRSRLPNGLTQGGFPNRHVSELPLFSLIYIMMLNDFLMWRGDKEFISKYMLGVETILYYFNNLIKPDGLVGRKAASNVRSCVYAPEWYIVDATKDPGWPGGEPPCSRTGDSYMVSFFCLYSLQHAINLFKCMGNDERADQLAKQADAMRSTLRTKAYDPQRQIFIDDPSGENISEHTNILAMLTDTNKGLVDGEALMTRIINSTDPKMVRATVYFRFYLYEAMYHVGRADLIWPNLKLWNDMLNNGLTTFLEKPEPSRSDCHAWSSHPLYHFVASILGVRPMQPGCSAFSIKPPPKKQTMPALPENLGAKIHIPQGAVEVRLTSRGNDWEIFKKLPVGTDVILQ